MKCLIYFSVTQVTFQVPSILDVISTIEESAVSVALYFPSSFHIIILCFAFFKKVFKVNFIHVHSFESQKAFYFFHSFPNFLLFKPSHSILLSFSKIFVSLILNNFLYCFSIVFQGLGTAVISL